MEHDNDSAAIVVNWFITDNSGNIQFWHDIDLKAAGIKYMAYQLEEGEQTHHRHVQGFISFIKKGRRSRVIKLIRGCNASPARDAEASRAYCMKEETRIDGPFERGSWTASKQGARTDLLEVQQMLDSGATVMDVAEAHFGAFLRYQRGIQSYAARKAPRRMTPPTVHVYWGATGTGKTRRAWEEAGLEGVFLLSTDKNYRWTGYEGEKKVIWDEFSGSECDIKYLLRLLDRYPLRVRGLYAEYELEADEFWITSNINPEHWYPNAHPEHQEALMRRLREYGTVEQLGVPDPGALAPPAVPPRAPDEDAIEIDEEPVDGNTDGVAVAEVAGNTGSATSAQLPNQEVSAPVYLYDYLESVQDDIVIEEDTPVTTGKKRKRMFM